MKASVALINLDEQKQNFGSIKTFRHSKKLYTDFYYFGHRITKSTGLNDTPENRAKVQEFLNRVFDKIEKQVFRFAEAFPGASEEEKALFSGLEGFEFKPEPHQVLIGDFVATWREKKIPRFDSATKRRDYLQALDNRILPYFKNVTFYQLTGDVLEDFIHSLIWEDGKNKGKKLSRSRIQNILIPLRAIWNSAYKKYRWTIHSPFIDMKSMLPKSEKSRPTVFRFDEWMEILRNIPEFYRPVSELMILTGMIASELRGLRKTDIEKNYICLANAIVLDEEKEKLKTWYRNRRIPITKAIRERLEAAIKCSSSEYVFVMEDGSPFNYASFQKNVWRKAFVKAGYEYQRPYVTRHSFAAWALAICVDQNKLVNLMGHSTKKMIYDVYGAYVDGLEEDAEKIYGYFGRDFLIQEKSRLQSFLSRMERYEAEAEADGRLIAA